MQVNGLIVEEINERGELKSFVLNKDYEIGDLWIAFPDEYESKREGPFHFLDEEYQERFSTVYRNVRMRKVGGDRFSQIGYNSFEFRTNWDNIPVNESYEVYYYSLFLPRYAYPRDIDFNLSVPTGRDNDTLNKIVKDKDRYVIYVMCKGSADRYHKPPQNLNLNVQYEVNRELFENRQVRNTEFSYRDKEPVSNQEFLKSKYLLEENQYDKLERLLELIDNKSISSKNIQKLSQVVGRKKKILFVSANPIATSRLRTDEEYREIDNGLRLSNGHGQFDLSIAAATRPNDLRREMLRFEPDFVHFSGHGELEGIVLEDNNGNPKLVSGDALSDLFSLFKKRTKCVILNSCYSEEQAKSISQFIPNVVGMKKSVPDKTAIQFSIGFYDAIGAGRNIYDAFRFGKNAINLNDISGAEIPVLIRN